MRALVGKNREGKSSPQRAFIALTINPVEINDQLKPER